MSIAGSGSVGQISGGISVGVGGKGGKGGHGGLVDLYYAGVISTYGTTSNGLIAQSVGGGGGNGGATLSGSLSGGEGSLGVSVGLGGSGGAAGDGGTRARVTSGTVGDSV